MSKSYMEEYQRWLDSPALSEEEWKELNSIAGDEKEIETASTPRSNSARQVCAAR